MPQFTLRFTLYGDFDGDRFVEMQVTASSAEDADILGDMLADRMPPQRVPDYGLCRWGCTVKKPAPEPR